MLLDVGGLAEGMSAVDLEVVFGSIGRVDEFVRTSGRSFAYVDFHCPSHIVMTKLFSTLLWVLILPLSQFLGMVIQEGTSLCGLRDHRDLDQAGRINFHSSPVLQFYGARVSPQKCKLQRAIGEETRSLSHMEQWRELKPCGMEPCGRGEIFWAERRLGDLYEGSQAKTV